MIYLMPISWYLAFTSLKAIQILQVSNRFCQRSPEPGISVAGCLEGHGDPKP